MRKILFIILFFIVGIFTNTQARNINIQLDSPFFDNSTTINIKELLGKKPILIIFFYPDCPPCEKESETVNKLYARYKEKVYIIGVSLSRDRYDIRDFIKKLKIKYPVWRVHSKSQLKSVGGILATPTVVILNKNGKIVAKYIGNRKYSFLKKRLDSLLKGEKKQCLR